jgi:starch phosphorylase
MWRHLEPLAGGAKPKIEVGTNGIHTETWLGHEIRSLVETRLGVDWQDRLCDEEYWQGLRKVEDAELWEAHLSQKERMIRLARHLLVEQYARHGHSPDEIREVAGMLNSRALIIGFARRFVSYKRADLIFRDFKRLQQIVSRADRPVHLIFSGKAHPADQSGQELIRRIVEISNESDLKRNVFFIEDYDMRIARHMVQGADVWLNTPRPPREASGTSGMKAAINGCVNLSIADGWWREGYNGRNGWMIVNGKEFDNPDMQYYADSDALWHLVENEVIPLYFNERKNDMPVGWVRMMKESMVSIITAFSARRMAMQYAANAYLPAIDRAAAA